MKFFLDILYIYRFRANYTLSIIEFILIIVIIFSINLHCIFLFVWRLANADLFNRFKRTHRDVITESRLSHRWWNNALEIASLSSSCLSICMDVGLCYGIERLEPFWPSGTSNGIVKRCVTNRIFTLLLAYQLMRDLSIVRLIYFCLFPVSLQHFSFY